MSSLESNQGQPRVRDLTVVGRGVLEVNIEAGHSSHIGQVFHNLDYTPMTFFYLRDEIFNYQQIPAQLFFAPTFITNYRCGANHNYIWVRIDMDSPSPADRTEYFYYFLIDNPLNVFNLEPF